jgi:hypothetical protein
MSLAFPLSSSLRPWNDGAPSSKRDPTSYKPDSFISRNARNINTSGDVV